MISGNVLYAIILLPSPAEPRQQLPLLPLEVVIYHYRFSHVIYIIEYIYGFVCVYFFFAGAAAAAAAS